MTVDARTGVLRRGVDWLFRDPSTGRITVVQRPNLPLVLFVAARLAGLLLHGTAAEVADWVGTVALGWWAVDEVVRGVNPFRRLLGAGVLVALVVSTASALVG